MNAASKVLHQSNLFHGHIKEMKFSFSQYLQITLFLAVLLSSLAVVYCTNQYRMNLSQLEHARMESSSLQLEWGQLLLEQASISAPSTIEQKASDILKMQMPDHKQTRIIHIR
jgi:cell division protein FtsL